MAASALFLAAAMTCLSIGHAGAGNRGGGRQKQGVALVDGAGASGSDRDLGGLVLPPFKEAMGSREIQWGWWSEDDKSWMDLLQGLYDTNLRGVGGRSRATGGWTAGFSSPQPQGSSGGYGSEHGGEDILGGIPKILHQ